MKIFFREIEIVGGEKVPREGPVIFIANHVNSLIDPALLMGFLPVRPRFLAKSTLWRQPAVRPFLELAAAIPVYRRQDAVDTSKNAETFAACHAVLACGGAIALFPEGRSHNEPALVPLKTGVSRIVLEAEHELGDESAPLGIRIVPVGLTFDDKGRFRSRALVHIGEPVDPRPETELYARDPVEAVRALTEKAGSALSAVTLNYPSWDEARLIRRAAEIFARPSAELPAEGGLGERFLLDRTFIEGYESLRERCPERVAEVARVVDEYDRQLRSYRLRDAQVASEYPPSGVARFVLKSLWLMSVRLPLALVGTVLHMVPYVLARRYALAGGRDPDVIATYKLFSSLFAYPFTWIVFAATGALVWEPWAAAVMIVLGPLSAWVALRYHERRDLFRRQARAFLLLRSGRRHVAELRRLRGEVLRAVRELAAEYEGNQDSGAGAASTSSPPRSDVQ